MAQTTATSYEDHMVLDRNNQKIGKIDSLYRDQNQGGSQLEWALVNTGLFGTKRSFVLLRGATMQEDDIRVAFDKDTVKEAPRVDTDDDLSTDEERRLFDHYGVAYDSDRNRGQSSDRNGSGNGEAMTRSEEEMHVGTETRERGRARLRKYVVTEHEQVTVPVQHEEVRIQREPIDSTNSSEALSGPAISEDEHEMTLHEERVVADTEAVPKERVRMDKYTETEQETVSADLRKERIDTDGGADRSDNR